jgi:hypothetical protein
MRAKTSFKKQNKTAWCLKVQNHLALQTILQKGQKPS